MRRLPSILFTLFVAITLLPFPSMAAESSATAAEPGKTTGTQNYYDEDVTWLGTTSEYQKTLKAFFDDSGLRKVEVNGKYGIVDKNGAFVAQPIYDEIKAYYAHREKDKTAYTDQNLRAEKIFVDGYVQAKRNEKMGLLDTKGKEVIPCNYDAVGLPSEGICRVSKKANGKTYIGYWSLTQGKEIVAPNKYPLPSGYEDLGDPEGGIILAFDMPDIGEDRIAVMFDFFDGYALVPTGKVTKIIEESTDSRDSYT